jgi:hypothetical protein
MAQFAPMMSAENPYVHGHGDGAAAGLEFVQRLRAAAGQQQQLQQKQLQQDFDHELQMRKAGYEPADMVVTSQPVKPTATTPGKLGTRDAPPNSDGRKIYTDPVTGKKWFEPAAKAAATPQQTYSDTNALFKDGAVPVSPQGTVHMDTDLPRLRENQPDLNQPSNITDTNTTGVNVPVPDQSRVQTPPGSQQSFYRPTEGEGLQQRLREEARKQEITHPGTDDIDTKSFNVPVHINKSTGKVTPLDLPAGVTAAEKPDKPEKYTYNHFTDDNGKVNVTRIGAGENGTPERWNGKAWETMPAGAAMGPRKKDPDAPPKPNPTQLRMITSKKASGLKGAESDFSKTMQSIQERRRKVNAQPAPGETAQQGQKTALGALDQEESAAKDTLGKAKQATQNEYEESLGTLGYPVDHFDYSGQQQTPAPTGGPPTRAGQTPGPTGGRGGAAAPAGARKAAGVDKVRAYAQRKGIDVAAAVKEFQAAGYSIGR